MSKHTAADNEVSDDDDIRYPVRKRQRTGSITSVTPPPHSPSSLEDVPALLHALPAEVVEVIGTMVASTYGMPTLISLMLTSSRLHEQLSSPGALGAVFDSYFDTSAAGRRILQCNGQLKEFLAEQLQDKTEGNHWFGGLTSAGSASQLPVYTRVLTWLKTASVYDADVRIMLTSALVMLLEDDSFDPKSEPHTQGARACYGNGMRLKEAGLGKFVLKWIRARLWETKAADGWPQVKDTSTVALWVFWMTLEEDMLQHTPEAEKMEIILLILPFVIMAFRYPMARIPPNHFHIPLVSLTQTHAPVTTVQTAHGPYPVYPTVVPLDTSYQGSDDQHDEDVMEDLPAPGSERSRAILAQAGISIESDGARLVIDKAVCGIGGEKADFNKVYQTLKEAGFYASEAMRSKMRQLYGDLFQKRTTRESKPTDVFLYYLSSHFVAESTQEDSRSSSLPDDLVDIEDYLSHHSDGDIPFVPGVISIPAKLIYTAYRETQKFGVPPHLADNRVERAIRAVNRAEEEGLYEDTMYNPDSLRQLLNETGVVTHATEAPTPSGLTKSQIVWGGHNVDLGPANQYDTGPTKEDLDEFAGIRAARLVPKYSQMEPINPSLSSLNERGRPPPTSAAASGTSKSRYTLAPPPNDGFDYHPSERFDHDYIRFTECAVDITKKRAGAVGRKFGEHIDGSSLVPGNVLSPSPTLRGVFDLPIGAWGTREALFGRKQRRTCYSLGSLTGLWQGRQVLPSNTPYHESMTDATFPLDFSESWFNMQVMPMFMRLQEHASCGGFHKSGDEDVTPPPTVMENGVVDDGIINAWFPIGTRLEHGPGYVTVHPPTANPTSQAIEPFIHQPSRFIFAEHGPQSPNAKKYETFVPGQPIKSLADAIENHNAEICPICGERRAKTQKDAGISAQFEHHFANVGLDAAPGVNDIIVTGGTDERHSQAWGARRIYGRIRHWDGLIGLMRIPMNGQNPEFLYGYIFGGQTFVGTWRMATARSDLPPWEGLFVLSRRDD